MLLGRDHERQQIDHALERARAGASATLALVGEPGIGKTTLLDYAASRAAGMQLLRARGIESETQVPFASLLELVRPALGLLDALPAPQATALEAALALRPARAQQRFAVGAATLGLLAALADRGPVAVLVDDAQWLDQPSAQAVLFAVRRLVADPIAVLIAARAGVPSLLDGTDLPRTALTGLAPAEAAALLDGVRPELAAQLHAATAGNPLALLELAPGAEALALVPEGAPVLLSTRIADAFAQRAAGLDAPGRGALLLAATGDGGDLATLTRAAARLGVDLEALAGAERAGLVSVSGGSVRFRHPLARSAIYAQAPAAERRAAHRALAAALPDRDVDRRAWHLAAAAIGADEAAAAALEQAALRALDRSAYATAAAAFERAARLAAGADQRARLLRRGAEAGWLAGLAESAVALLDEARDCAQDPAERLELDRLAGHIATRRGPIRDGRRILVAAAERADPERAVAMLAEAAAASFYAGEPAEMLAAATRARALLPAGASERARFLAAGAFGIAHVVGGDAAAGAAALHEAIALAEGSAALRDDLELLPWLAVAPIFLRESEAGRPLLRHALDTARARAAIGALPFVLNLVARDQATTDRWAVAEACYQEAIGLARETDQQTDLVFGLAGLAWLQARRGQEHQCRANAAEADTLSRRLGARLHEIWVAAARGELALGLGDVTRAAARFEEQLQVAARLGVTDPDLFPAELIDAYVRLGLTAQAGALATRFLAAARAKGQPWSLARAWRCQGLVTRGSESAEYFETALAHHRRTPDGFEAARTRLAYGERLRRTGDRIRAREQLRLALERFERLGARPWSDRARAELTATGETSRRRDPSTLDELTPQELHIALLLAGGQTTRQAAAAMFLSPKTIEYHLRHVYLKLGVHTRAELAAELDGQHEPAARAPRRSPAEAGARARASQPARRSPADTGAPRSH